MKSQVINTTSEAQELLHGNLYTEGTDKSTVYLYTLYDNFVVLHSEDFHEGYIVESLASPTFWQGTLQLTQD
jgi:hypothetical protein